MIIEQYATGTPITTIMNDTRKNYKQLMAIIRKAKKADPELENKRKAALAKAIIK
jgi:hypothetical protein